MISEEDIQVLTFAHIAQHCACETARYFNQQEYDPSYCFEIFRRAIINRNQQAWQFIYQQYYPLVNGWVKHHSAFASSGEESQYFVNRAFEKMWEALNPEKFTNFPDLKHLLRYLQMCVHSCILDWTRRKSCPQIEIPDTWEQVLEASPAASVEKQTIKKMERQTFWEQINQRLNNEKEHKVMYGSFILALKPRELHTHYQDTFKDVREIYRIKENILARLRRDSDLENFFVGGA